MKTVKMLLKVIMVMSGLFFTNPASYAQNAESKAELKVIVTGIKEAKGNIMIAIGSPENPQAMIADMIALESTDDLVCEFKNVPVGKVNLYVFQDMNGNYQLDQDENQIPVEPCYTKEKLKIEEGTNEIKIKLMDVREMMGINF